MSDLNPTSRLPERQIPDAQVDTYRDFYIELLGFVPPRIQARTELLARLDPELLELQEAMRRKCMYPSCFDTKTSQLMLFGMLLITLRDAAKLHGIAAYRAGATFEELSAVVNFAYLFGGLSAANLGAQYLQEIAKLAENPG